MSQQLTLFLADQMAEYHRQLLEATGNIWAVTCYDGGNRRNVVRTVYCRTETRERAEAIGRSVSKRRCVDARPWDPTGGKFRQYIQQQKEVRP